MEPLVKFAYKSFVCSPDDLDALLNEAGAESWRLHTCEPVGIIGVEGVGSLVCFVVMDQHVIIEEPEEYIEEEVKAFDGLRMRS